MNRGFVVFMVVTLVVVALPSRERPVVKDNYKDYIRRIVCDQVQPIDESQADWVRSEWEEPLPLQVNLTAIINKGGQKIKVNWTKILTSVFFYVAVATGLFLVTRTMRQIQKNKVGQGESPVWLPSATVLGAILIFCLLAATFIGIRGVSHSYQITNQTNHMICDFLGYPQTFPSKSGPILSLSDIHNSAIAARDYAKYLERNLTDLQKLINEANVLGNEWSTALGQQQEALRAVKKVSDLVNHMKVQAHWLASDLLYLREIIYWSQTIFTFVPSLINDYYDISQLGYAVGCITWTVWMTVILTCCGCVVWFMKSWWAGKGSILGVRRIGFGIGAVISLLVVVGLWAWIWAALGLSVHHVIRQDVKQIPFYIDLKHTEISYNSEDGYNLNIGLKHFANAIHPTEQQNFMTQESTITEHYLQFEVAATSIGKVHPSTFDSEFSEKYATLADRVSEVSESIKAVREVASEKGVFGRVDLTPFGVAFSRLVTSVTVQNTASWMESHYRYLWGAVWLLGGVVACLGLMVKMRETMEVGREEKGVELGSVSAVRSTNAADV